MTDPQPSSDPAAPVRRTWVRWRVVLILMGFTGLNHFHRQSLPAVVQEIMRDCGFSKLEMGSIYSAFLLGYVIAMVGGGRLADLRGGWFALVVSGIGTGCLVAFTGLCGLAVSTAVGFASFLGVRFLMGLFTAPLFPAAGRIVGAWIPFETRGWSNGLVLGATTIGVALAPIVFGSLSDLVGWRAACGVMGALTIVLSCVWFQFGRDRPADHPHVNASELALVPHFDPAERQARGPDFVEWLKNPSLVFLTFNYAAVGYYEYTLFYWMKYYFSEVLEYSEDASRYFTGIVSSAMIVAMPVGGILSDWLVRVWGYRAGRMCVPIVAMLASAGLLFSATQAEQTAVVVGLFFLSHAAIGLCEAPTWVAALEIGGEHCGTSAAIVNTGGNLGGLLAPVVTAYVAQEYGWTMGFVVASVVCLVGVVQWFGVRLPEKGTGPNNT
ncbi:MAG: MFS transporter [Planctomycetia bacterium]|nr:MFS transporter [Planctomycetia bacterium]